MRMNPAITKLGRYQRTESPAATYRGVTFKSLYFGGLTLVAALVSFFATYNLQNEIIFVLVAIAPMVALISGLVAAFAPSTIPVTGTIYVLFEGLTLGFLSAVVNSVSEYGGVVFMALLSTVVAFVGLAVLYGIGVIRVGAFFRKFMISALTAIVVSQLILFVISLFSPAISNMFYGNTLLSLLISIGMAIFATLMLLFDFSNMTIIVEQGMDKKYEWFGAFGLVTTLIWMYVQFLRLFMILASRRN